MRILKIRTLAGPNFYSHQPALMMRLDLEDLTQKQSRDIPGFADRLLDLLPGLRRRQCSKGKPGGFVERLREGAHFARTVEQVALELAELAGVATALGEVRL